ncbi:MAG: helix-turn-helix transcriptional regulator [Porticoccaceae bacterium]|jgi:transcriptional regulator with XRE-family HTH domain|nr:helix-turn-helix transcriptional regulator [Porticoccaceae bacterium]
MSDSELYTASLGPVLRAQRKEKGLSQEELAHRVGLDRTYISLLERGLRQPTLGTIVKLSTALEIQPEDFVAELGRPYKVD